MDHKERYRSLKERGICVYCKTAPAEDGKTTCRICREKQRIQTTEKRAALKALGICTSCGSNKIYGSETLCPECAAKKYASNRKRQNAEKNRQYQHDRKEHLKAAGICIKCGKRPAEKGKTRCVTCNIKERDRAKRYRGGGISRSERPAYGLCYFCGEKIQEGKICEKCKEQIVQNFPKEHTSNEYWKKQSNQELQKL